MYWLYLSMACKWFSLIDRPAASFIFYSEHSSRRTKGVANEMSSMVVNMIKEK